jgi:hypothetical protein
MARTDPYDIHRQDYDYYANRPQNTGTGWLVAFILIVAAVAAVMFFGRADYNVSTSPMTAPSSTVNPPLAQPTPPAAIPSQNAPAR